MFRLSVFFRSIFLHDLISRGLFLNNLKVNGPVHALLQLVSISSLSYRKIPSLRSKRFQSSYSAKVGAGAKKWKGEGEGRRGSFFTPLPLPLHSIHCVNSQFYRREIAVKGVKMLRLRDTNLSLI